MNFTSEKNKKSIPFLDLNVKLANGKLGTNLHIKSTDRHHYLHYMSSHPEHTKRSIVYSQALRINKLCSLETDFNVHKLSTKEWFIKRGLSMKEWFIKRGYPETLIEKEMNKVKFSRESQNTRKVEKGVPFVATYHPLLKWLPTIIYRNLSLLYMNEECKRIFTSGPMVSFRGTRKISSYLVRAKLYPLGRTVGSKKCGKSRCDVCLNVEETDTFTSSVT